MPRNVNERDLVEKQLNEAKGAGMENEVVYEALMAMKENPKLQPSEAMAIGLKEWDV